MSAKRLDPVGDGGGSQPFVAQEAILRPEPFGYVACGAKSMNQVRIP